MRFHVMIGAMTLAVLPAQGVAAQERLPALGADPAQVSVSGLSSGAFMAVQYAVAWSSEVMGAGIVAGGPYNCAPPNGALFIDICMRGTPSGERSWAAAQGFARDRVIDPVSNIARQRIYLFGGTADSVVVPTVMPEVRRFYELAGVPADRLQWVGTMPAGHAFLSAEIGEACGANTGHFVVRCPLEAGGFYDQPKAILSQIYGPLAPAAPVLSSEPFAFDQSAYTGSDSRMAKEGFAYVPVVCRKARAACRVHVVFHGCLQSAALVGEDIYARLGYNRWADSNRIVMLYPQIDKGPGNPMGCWDWWGFSAFNFQLRHGPQIIAVHSMIARLTARP